MVRWPRNPQLPKRTPADGACTYWLVWHALLKCIFSVGAARDCCRGCCKLRRGRRHGSVEFNFPNPTSSSLGSLRDSQQSLEQSLEAPTSTHASGLRSYCRTRACARVVVQDIATPRKYAYVRNRLQALTRPTRHRNTTKIWRLEHTSCTC